jgi:hypothetical protein
MDSIAKVPHSPPRHPQELQTIIAIVPHSPPRKSQELKAKTAKGPPSPPQHPHPQPQELEATNESFESEFYVAGQKVEVLRRKKLG